MGGFEWFEASALLRAARRLRAAAAVGLRSVPCLGRLGWCAWVVPSCLRLRLCCERLEASGPWLRRGVASCGLRAPLPSLRIPCCLRFEASLMGVPCRLVRFEASTRELDF